MQTAVWFDRILGWQRPGAMNNCPTIDIALKYRRFRIGTPDKNGSYSMKFLAIVQSKF